MSTIPLIVCVCAILGSPDETSRGEDPAPHIPMPEGDVFEALLADPKQPHSYASALWAKSEVHSRLVASVAFGDDIGLVRWTGAARGDGIQIGVAGAVFAQFDLLAASVPLMNADYTIGVPITYRRRPWSARGRLYHQSSHLGDEYLLTQRPERVNLSFEALELIASFEHGPARGYAGGEYLFHRYPRALRSFLWHGGLEYRHPRWAPLAAGAEARVVAGADLKRDWSRERLVDVSLRAGIEIGPALADGEEWRHHWDLLAEYYDGNSPYGQFFTERVSFFGIGIHFFL